MKKIIVLILMLLPMSAIASVPELAAMVDKYSTVEDATVVTLNGDMLKMAMAESDAASASVEGLESLCVLTTEVASLVSEIGDEFDRLTANLTLTTLTNIEADGAKVRILANKGDEAYNDIIIYVRESAELVIVMISGDIQESMIGELVGGMMQM
ncbi:MAG: DUF4252 domain-containing protein [Alistipes sp.]|nr:DUF4252 domain-containing protein [Alistipes sp.]